MLHLRYNKAGAAHRRLSFILIGIVLVVLIGWALAGDRLFGFLNFAQLTPAPYNPTQKQGELKEFSNENGYVELKIAGDKKVFTKGSQEKIDVNITLMDKQVAGFNIPVRFDDSRFTFVGVENLDARFNMYARIENSSYVILVAVQQQGNTDKITLHKANVARLIFKATASGANNFEVQDKTPKGYALKLVNEKNVSYTPSSGTLQVTTR